MTADELAEMLYNTITTKLTKLPDETLLYPAHGAGSLCGKSLSNDLVSTIGVQKKENYALQPMSKTEFIDLVKVDQPDAPEYFVYDAIKNRQERASLEETMQHSFKPLELSAVLTLQEEGAQIVDVREGVDFEGAHLFGAVNVGLEGKYATWAGSVLNHDQPIVVITNPGDAEEAIMRLGRIGFDNVAGYLKGGMTALQNQPDLVQTTLRMTAFALAEELPKETASIVVDVRTEKEWERGHIAGSINIPLNHLKERWTEIPEKRPVVVHCEGGYRSAIACSLLQKRGLEDVTDLIGGIKAWQASHLPTDPASCATTSCSL